MLPTDPLFYLLAIPAVLINGMAKGGLGSILGSVSVPLMALAIAPVQAAAILLPLLLFMDMVSLWKFRGQFHSGVLKSVLPGCLLGVLFGTLIFRKLSENNIRLLIGVISLAFCFIQWLRRNNTNTASISYTKGNFWGSLSGFTSFGIHAGGPPISIYLLPLKLNSHQLMGTQAWIFATMNVSKIFAYAELGQLGLDNLATSLILLPVAPFGVLIGYWLLNKLSQRVIYSFCYLSLTILGITLSLQGLGLCKYSCFLTDEYYSGTIEIRYCRTDSIRQ